jgi:HEAT repeat protein
LDNPKEDPAIRRAIPQVLARIDDQLSMDVLSNMLDWEEELLRSAALNAVVQLHLKNPGLRRDREKLRRALRRDLKEAYQLQAMAVELVPLDGELLQENIQHRYDQGIERIFKLLRVLHPGRPLETIQRNLKSPHSAIRANSLELLDNVLDTDTRRCLIPLLEERDPASLAASGDALFPLLHLNARQWLHRMLVSDHEWTVVCALETVGRLPDGTTFESTVRILLENPSPLVREAAAFCLKRLLAPESLAEAVSPLDDDPDPQVRAAVRFLAGPLPSTSE